MGQKSKKKSGAGSASKLKKLDDLAPTVALPAANEGEAIISVDAIVTGEAMAGEIGAPTSISESESLRKQNTVANSSGNLKEMENSKSDCCVLDAAGSEVFAKPISINWKVLKNAQNLKTAVPYVSPAGMDTGVKNNSGTINVEVVNAGNSSLEKLPAGVNATNPISGDVFAGFCSPNTQNICINSKAKETVNSRYEEEFILNARGLKLFTCRWLPTHCEPKALVFLCHGYGMECSISMRVIGPGVGMTGDVMQPLVNVIEVSNAPPNLEKIAVTSGNATRPVDNDFESTVMSKNSENMAGISGNSVDGSAQPSGDNGILSLL